MISQGGMLRVVGGSALSKQEQDDIVRRQAEEKQQEPLITNLAAYMRTCFDAAKMAKQPIERLLLKAKRQRNGEYESDKLADITKSGGSVIYMSVTDVKCRAAESWIRDILLDAGSPPWDLQASPVPDLPPTVLEEVQNAFSNLVIQQIQSSSVAPTPDQIYNLKQAAMDQVRLGIKQAAEERAERMADKIRDQFTEGGWDQAFNEFVTDLVTYPAAIVKGPVVRRQMSLSWALGPDGKTHAVPVERLAPEFERVDPFRFFPEPGLSNVNDGYCFEHHKLSRSDLAALIGVPGYDDNSIRAALHSGNKASWFFMPSELTKNELENKFSSWMNPVDQYDALEFYGKISGTMLLEWGIAAESIPDRDKEYDANVWLVGNYVIKAILNSDPLGQKPYAVTSFYKVPGALWGKGIPQAIEDIQDVCNAAARSLVNNMALASGPQIEVDIDRLPPNEDITQVYPWKIWQVNKDSNGQSGQAVHFFQPDDRAAQLMNVYDKFARLADEHSGIPSYVSGDISVTGAGRTSSGLSMLMGAAGKGIRQVVSYIDNDVTKVIVQRQFEFNMRFDSDESIKGDVVVSPRGAVNLAIKETNNARKVEFLQLTANPYDIQVIGLEGRAAVLRDVSKSLNMPTDEIVPSREELKLKKLVLPQQQGQTAQQQPGAQELDASGAPAGGTNVQTSANTGGAG